jgi:hypothetical protein
VGAVPVCTYCEAETDEGEWIYGELVCAECIEAGVVAWVWGEDDDDEDGGFGDW